MKKLLLSLITLFFVVGQALAQIPKDTVTIKHSGYTTLWSPTLDYPLLVQWWDTKERCGCNQIERKDQFGPDPIVEKSSGIQKEYDAANQAQKAKSLKGFDRGHMCPAADNECPITVAGKKVDAQKVLTECFYFTNMAPQYHSLNAGDWKKLEERTRELALQYDSVYVWCGSFGTATIIDGLHIPTKCWKVIYIKKTKTYEYYIFDNTADKPVGLDHWKVKKEDIEKATGFKFNQK